DFPCAALHSELKSDTIPTAINRGLALIDTGRIRGDGGNHLLLRSPARCRPKRRRPGNQGKDPGMEAACTLRVGSEQYMGKARLDPDHIDFTGQTKFRFRLAEIRDPAMAGGSLRFEFHGNRISLSVGDRTNKWYEAVINPKTPAQKLGLHAGDRVRVVNIEDPVVLESLAEAKIDVTTDRVDDCDAILLTAERPQDLRQVPSLVEILAPTGAIWIFVPKTTRNLTQGNIVATARAVGMTDIRETSVSDLHNAYRLS